MGHLEEGLITWCVGWELLTVTDHPGSSSLSHQRTSGPHVLLCPQCWCSVHLLNSSGIGYPTACISLPRADFYMHKAYRHVPSHIKSDRIQKAGRDRDFEKTSNLLLVGREELLSSPGYSGSVIQYRKKQLSLLWGTTSLHIDVFSPDPQTFMCLLKTGTTSTAFLSWGPGGWWFRVFNCLPQV